MQWNALDFLSKVPPTNGSLRRCVFPPFALFLSNTFPPHCPNFQRCNFLPCAALIFFCMHVALTFRTRSAHRFSSTNVGLLTSLKVGKFIEYVKKDERFRTTLAKTVGLCTGVYAVLTVIDYAFMQGFFERHFGTGLAGFALYMCLWALPIYLAVMQFFGADFRKITELAYSLHNGAHLYKPVEFKYTIYRTVFYVVFLGMATAPIVLPYVGLPLSFILTSLVYTFLSFDAKWLLLGEKSFADKVNEFQSAWAFFLGFGFIFGIVTILVPPFLSCATYAIFYPVVFLSLLLPFHFLIPSLTSRFLPQFPLFSFLFFLSFFLFFLLSFILILLHFSLPPFIFILSPNKQNNA